MTLLETSVGAALVVGLVALALIGAFLIGAPRRLTRGDIEADDWMGDRQ